MAVLYSGRYYVKPLHLFVEWKQQSPKKGSAAQFPGAARNIYVSFILHESRSAAHHRYFASEAAKPRGECAVIVAVVSYKEYAQLIHVR